MTSSRRIVLTCDRNGCYRTFVAARGIRDVLDARQAATGDGWSRVWYEKGSATRLDFCPAHTVVPQ